MKASLWLTLANVVLRGVSFITAPIFTRVLSLEEYGKASLFASYEQIIIIFATWELGLGAYQRAYYKYRNDEKLLTASAVLLDALLTIILFGIILLCWKPFSVFTGFSPLSITILFLYSIVLPSYSCWYTRKKTVFDYKKTVSVSLATSLLSTIAPLVAVLIISRTGETRFIFGLIPAVIIYSYFFVRSFNIDVIRNNKNKAREIWKFFISFTPPLAIHALSYFILGQADRIMIGKMVDSSYAAIYSVAYTLGSIASIIQSSISQVMVPWLYNNMETRNYENIRKKSLIMFVGIGVVYLLFMLVSPEVMRIMFPFEYYDAIWCIPPIAIGSYFMFLYSMFVNAETYMESSKYVAYVSVTCAVLNIMLNYFGIKIFGYIACAYTTLICYIFFAIGHYYFMRKLSKEKINGEQIFNGKAIFLLCITVVLLMLIITLFYRFIIARYVVVTVLLIIGFRKRAKIISILRTMKVK